MRRQALIGIMGILLFFTSAPGMDAYLVQYKEQFYRLFHLHYIQYPDDTMENIYWLEQAVKGFCQSPLRSCPH